MLEFTPIASSSAGCSYHLGSGTHPGLLIDAGVRFSLIQRALDFQVSKLAGAIISHAHGDHIKAAPDLMRAGVDCWASKETWEQALQSGYRARFLEHRVAQDIEGWTVVPFEAVHDAPGTFGFVVDSPDGPDHGRLLYLTDSAYSKFRYPCLTHVAIEANWSSEIMRANAMSGQIDTGRYKRVTSTHMSLQRVIQMLKANDLSKCEQIVLMHLSDENSDEAVFRAEVEKATGVPTYVAGKQGGLLH